MRSCRLHRFGLERDDQRLVGRGCEQLEKMIERLARQPLGNGYCESFNGKLRDELLKTVRIFTLGR